MFSQQDTDFMARAIALAELGQYTTTPNPNVGCLIVKAGKVIGEGWHQKAGTGHAEVNALAELSVEQSTGSTAYVTLEPCSHYGRTPPCSERLIEAKVSRVVIAMLDPNPLVSGRGVKMLEEAGIEVQFGLLEPQARALNPGFLCRMEHKRPFVQVKLASSIDGKTALENGESKWITGTEARADVQVYRAKASAILSTAETIIADNAKLNVRAEQLPIEYPQTDTITSVRQPLRIVLDGRDRLTSDVAKSLTFFDNAGPILLVKARNTQSQQYDDNVTLLHMDYDSNSGFDLNQLLLELGPFEVNTLWVEAGARLASRFVENNLFDELIVYQAPKIMGKNAREMLPVGPHSKMSDVTELQFKSIEPVGRDVKFILVKGH